MAVNDRHRQVGIAVELDEAARTLAHSTRDVPNPIDSYRLLAELGPTVDHLQQVVRQLSDWHRRVVEGREYLGEDETGDGVTSTLEAPSSSRWRQPHWTGRAKHCAQRTLPTASSDG